MHDLVMPASYTLVAEDEMVYLDGGNELLDSVASFVAGIPAAVVSNTGVVLQSVWASVKNVTFGFAYMAIDDLLNPKFQGTMIAIGLLMLCTGTLLPESFGKTN
jgi:hypothetical protein